MVNKKDVLVGIGVFVIVGFFFWFFSAGDKEKSTPIIPQKVIKIDEDESVNISTIKENSDKTIPIFSIGETVAAGKFEIIVTDPMIVTEIEGKNTDNQFVVMTVKIINNDDRARDVSNHMFTLVDSQGRTYEASDIYSDGFLTYDTINPGLNKTGKIAFETSKGLTGFELKADSGVALAGGEPVIIDLGI